MLNSMNILHTKRTKNKKEHIHNLFELELDLPHLYGLELDLPIIKGPKMQKDKH